MSIVVSDIRTRFPEFSDDSEYPDARIQLFIDDSEVIYMGSEESRWGDKYNIAQSYLVAHLLHSASVQEAGDALNKSGPISSKSAGGVSVTRAVVAKDRSDQDYFLSTTSYGQRFLEIRRLCFPGVITAR